MRGPNRKRIPRARELRRQSTSAESKLWAELRNRQLDGFKFVRQVPIGGYVADFVCREAKLRSMPQPIRQMTKCNVTPVVQLSWKDSGYAVLRVQNDDVYNAMEGVLRTVREALGSPRNDG